MFPSLHKLLVDNLAGIILARLNMNGLFHDRIRPAAEGLACAVLHTDLISNLLSAILLTASGIAPGKGQWKMREA